MIEDKTFIATFIYRFSPLDGSYKVIRKIKATSMLKAKQKCREIEKNTLVGSMWLDEIHREVEEYDA